MTTEAEFIRQALAEEQEKLTQIPIQFRAAQRATDREIDALCEEAGILDKVQTLRERMENAQKALQIKQTSLQGKRKSSRPSWRRTTSRLCPPGSPICMGSTFGLLSGRPGSTSCPAPTEPTGNKR